MSQSFGRCWAVIVAALPMVFLFAPIEAEGQIRTASRQQDQGQFMDGLVRDLVDSQMNFHSSPLEPVPAANVTVELQRARQELQKFSQHADRLVTALRYEDAIHPVSARSSPTRCASRPTPTLWCGKLRHPATRDKFSPTMRNSTAAGDWSLMNCNRHPTWDGRFCNGSRH